jgi:membrane-associated protein
MTTLKYLIELFLHVDKNLAIVIQNFGGWSYGILAWVIFMETGLVVVPFLPGDSLLFAAGALGARGLFNMPGLYILMLAAAIGGNIVNYSIGRYIGPRAFEMNNRFLKKKYLDKAQEFFAKHGSKTIILTRFVPIVRTFAPFVAGIGKMNFAKFNLFNFLGGFAWVTLFVWSGYFFGNIPVVKANFDYVVVAIVLVSMMPMVIEWLKSKRKAE